jgi:hypothetical protein
MVKCHNPNIAFMTKLKCKGTWGQKSMFGSETHFTSGGGGVQEIEGPMTPKCSPILGVALVQDSWIFKFLVEKENKH